MLGELLFNLAALIAFCILSTFFMDRWPMGRAVSLWIQGVVFGTIAIAGMVYNVPLGNGVYIDGRGVVLSLAAWHFGWRAALVSGAMTLAYRLHLGGGGALAGVFLIASSSSIGLVFRRWVNPESEDTSLIHVASLGLAVNVAAIFLSIFLLPQDSLKLFAEKVVIPLLTFFPVATILAGRILGDYQTKMRAQSQVALNESMIRTLFEDSPLMVLLLDPATKTIIDANDTAIDFYGYPKNTLVTLGLKDLEVKQQVKMGSVMRVRDSIPQPFYHLKHKVASGKIQEVDVCSGIIHFEGREVELMFVVDITERINFIRRTQEALQEKEDILQAAMDGFWIMDDTFTILEVNEAYCAISGYLPEEIVGQDIRTFDVSDEPLRNVVEQNAHHQAVRFMTHHKTKDGQLIDLEVSVRGKNSDQKNLYYVFFRDVTAERASQKQMDLQTACLSVAQNSVVITDTSENIEWVNNAFCTLSGYRKDEACGRTAKEVFQSEVNSPSAYKGLIQAREAGEPWQGELTNIRKDGSHYTVNATLTPVKDSEGNVTHYIGIHQDITEKKELEKLYLRSQRLETTGRLTSGIAHDLNNIFSPIMMSAEMLQANLKEAENKKLADVIATASNRGGALLQQLLSFARGSSVEKQSLPPGPLIKESFKMYKETFPKNITMKIRVSNQLPPVAVDPGQLGQVLGNLLVNAKDAMPDGGTLTLEAAEAHLDEQQAKPIPFARAGSFLRIRISDTGAGIDQNEIDKVFEPFFSTKPKGKGTGLGLPTCLNIVKGHDGFITIASEANRGTQVDIYLPITETVAEKPAAYDHLSMTPPRSGEGKHILVVDDEEAIRQLIKASLEPLGYDISMGRNGQEALNHISKDPKPDLMILDLEMPLKRGEDVIREMEKQHLDIPVLLITGMQDDANEPDPILKDRPILYKPFTLDQLNQAVETQLHTHSA